MFVAEKEEETSQYVLRLVPDRDRINKVRIETFFYQGIYFPLGAAKSLAYRSHTSERETCFLVLINLLEAICNNALQFVLSQRS